MAPVAASEKAAAKRLANLRPFKPGQSGSAVKSKRYLQHLQRFIGDHLQRFIGDLGVRDLGELPGIDQIAVEQIIQQLLRAERCKDHAESARCSRNAREWTRQLLDRRAGKATPVGSDLDAYLAHKGAPAS
jgi:hypothetical protein